MEIVTGLSAAQIAVLGAAVIGVTEFINRLRAKDLWVAVSIATAAVVGALVAAYYSVDPVSGAVLGLSGSGLLKTLGSVGNKSTPAPSSVVTKAKQKVV